jgi:hypothetical protein
MASEAYPDIQRLRIWEAPDGIPSKVDWNLVNPKLFTIKGAKAETPPCISSQSISLKGNNR